MRHHRNILTGISRHFLFFNHTHHPVNGRGGVCNHGAGLAPIPQAAVRLISTVGKHLAAKGHALLFRCLLQTGACRCQQHQQLKHGRGEDGAVKPVEHTAVTGQQIAVVLHAVLALDGGKRQVARLSGKAAEETVDGEQTDLHAVAAQVQYEAVEHGRRDRAHKAADAALDRLMRAQRRGELGLAQAAADEKRARIAQPRDDERQQQVRRFGVVQAKAHERREHPRDDDARREHERQILKRDALGLVKRDHHLDEHGHEQHVGRDLEHELRLSERRAEHDGRAAHTGIHRKARHELRHGRVQQLPGAERRHDGHHDAPTPDWGEEDHGQQRRDADGRNDQSVFHDWSLPFVFLSGAAVISRRQSAGRAAGTPPGPRPCRAR